MLVPRLRWRKEKKEKEKIVKEPAGSTVTPKEKAEIELRLRRVNRQISEVREVLRVELRG
jgi:hypothetical protein